MKREVAPVELFSVVEGILLVLAYKMLKTEVLDVDLNTLFQDHGKVILAGDLSCKHPA